MFRNKDFSNPQQLARRRAREAQTLANLTGWDINGMCSRAGLNSAAVLRGLRARIAAW